MRELGYLLFAFGVGILIVFMFLLCVIAIGGH